MNVLFEKEDIFVRRDGDVLWAGNRNFRRKLDLSGHLLRTMEISDGGGRVFAGNNVYPLDFSYYGFSAEVTEIPFQLKAVDAVWQENCGYEAPHAEIRITLFDPKGKMTLIREFILYPELPVCGVRCRAILSAYPVLYWNRSRAIQEQYREFIGEERWPVREPVVDTLLPAAGFSVRRTVEFQGHTDIHDEPVIEHPYHGAETEQGNLLYCESDDGAGFAVLQEAPPSSERRELESYDFRITRAGEIRSIGWGITPGELPLGREIVSCRSVILLYHDGEERETLLKDYLRKRFAEHSSLRPRIVVNAWGCGNFGGRLSPEFLDSEIRGTVAVGGEIYQVDDTWETGKNFAELTRFNRVAELPEFWSVNPERIGQEGFDRWTALAAKHGVELGLWFAPSTNIAYRDWQEFSDLLLHFHRRYGFRLFKLDNASFYLAESESNFEKMLLRTRQMSGGKVEFNLDVTAAMRGGYFRFLEYGNLFLENRYVCVNWGLGYHPEKTLRNFWNLARYVRPQSLQIECPYPGNILNEFYDAKQCSRPSVYPWEYWLAITLFANPLLWFAPADVTEEDRSRCKTMMGLHKRIREELFRGEIYPTGSEPDGKSVTGFISRPPSGGKAFLLLFRERAAEEPQFFCRTDGWKILAGEGEIVDTGIRLPKKCSWVLLEK